MSRRYLPAILCTLLYIAAGTAFGACWYAFTGRTDMPPLVVVALVVVAGLISDMAEGVLRGRQVRRQRTAAARHRKAAP
jgi:uncharacterized integral membrane protein